jgi:hypothetical protein
MFVSHPLDQMKNAKFFARFLQQLLAFLACENICQTLDVTTTKKAKKLNNKYIR